MEVKAPIPKGKNTSLQIKTACKMLSKAAVEEVFRSLKNSNTTVQKYSVTSRSTAQLLVKVGLLYSKYYLSKSTKLLAHKI